MYKSELIKIVKSKWTYLVLAIFIFLSIYDTKLNNIDFFPVKYIEERMLLSSNIQGHITSLLLFFPLPIFIFLFSTERLLREKSNDAFLAELIRASRKKVIRAKIIVSSLLFSSAMLLLLVFNMISAVLFLHVSPLSRLKYSYDNDPNVKVIELFKSIPSTGLWSYQHHFLTYVLYVLFTLLMTFALVSLCTLIALAFPYRKIAYPLALVYWAIMLSLNDNVLYATQPFTEYGFSYVLAGLLVFLVVTGILCLILYRKVVRDDAI